MPVAAIDLPLVLRAIEPLWVAKPVTANRVRNRVEMVLDWAKVRGLRQGENPARWKGHLDTLLPHRSDRRCYRARLPPRRRHRQAAADHGRLGALLRRAGAHESRGYRHGAAARQNALDIRQIVSSACVVAGDLD